MFDSAWQSAMQQNPELCQNEESAAGGSMAGDYARAGDNQVAGGERGITVLQ